MAFLRKENRKGHTYEYWVENRRVNGKVRQKHLGKANEASLVTRLYRGNIGPVPPVIADELEKAAGLPEQWVRTAFREAASFNALNWAYVSSILDRYQKDGFGPPRRESRRMLLRGIYPPAATSSAPGDTREVTTKNRCPRCGFVAGNEGGLAHHLKVHEREDARRAGTIRGCECPECGFVAATEGGLSSHLRAHERADARGRNFRRRPDTS